MRARSSPWRGDGEDDDREPLRIAVVGTGAIGTILAARLSMANDVVVFARTTEAAERVERMGLVVDGAVPRRVPVAIDPARLGTFDALVIAVKTGSTPALAPFAPSLRDDTIVLTIQNGLGNDDRLRDALGSAIDVVLAPTTIGGTALAPGRVANVTIGTTTMGRVPGSAPRGDLDRLAREFEGVGLPVERPRDIRSAVWGKLVVSCTINALAAAHGVPNGALVDDPDLRVRAAELTREAAAVARALGIALPYRDAVGHVERVALATAANRNSMLQDLEAGRPTEVASLNGAIARAGERAHVATPAHRAMISAIERLTANTRPGHRT